MAPRLLAVTFLLLSGLSITRSVPSCVSPFIDRVRLFLCGLHGQVAELGSDRTEVRIGRVETDFGLSGMLERIPVPGARRELSALLRGPEEVRRPARPVRVRRRRYPRKRLLRPSERRPSFGHMLGHRALVRPTPVEPDFVMPAVIEPSPIGLAVYFLQRGRRS